MMLNLSQRQYELLNEALTRQLARLQDELVHTDQRAYREDLKRTVRDFEELQRQLSMRAVEDAVYG